MRFTKKQLITAIAWACVSVTLSYAQDSIKPYKEQDLNFNTGGNEIFGKLILPSSVDGKFPVIVFIHGSGPEDYSSSDNYRYLWQEFTKIGYACYSWDRPGVGGSQGKWYESSVEDRADEVIKAVDKLKTLDCIDASKIGFWGISQAGWVIPQAAKTIKPAFIITVSAPVTTAFDQELYRVASEMKAEGFSKTDVDEAISYNRKLLKLIQDDKPYGSFHELQKETENAKWADNVIRGDDMVYKYLSIVFTRDAVPDLSNLNCPVLAIWGENDLVVPPKLGLKVYSKELQRIGNMVSLMKIIPDADHTMTLNLTGRRSETIRRREQYKDNPKEIFTPGYVSLMSDWLVDLYR